MAKSMNKVYLKWNLLQVFIKNFELLLIFPIYSIFPSLNRQHRKLRFYDSHILDSFFPVISYSNDHLFILIISYTLSSKGLILCFSSVVVLWNIMLWLIQSAVGFARLWDPNLLLVTFGSKHIQHSDKYHVSMICYRIMPKYIFYEI